MSRVACCPWLASHCIILHRIVTIYPLPCRLEVSCLNLSWLRRIVNRTPTFMFTFLINLPILFHLLIPILRPPLLSLACALAHGFNSYYLSYCSFSCLQRFQLFALFFA
ncbi:hypothetical protein BKA57DRAFT_296609 [Linnemannia elongata]|nr:hypothetical protein BKA57DRAFT_296609 [Linnemannia elongata]